MGEQHRRVEPRAIVGTGMATDPERVRAVETESARRARAWRDPPARGFGDVLVDAPARGQLERDAGDDPRRRRAPRGVPSPGSPDGPDGPDGSDGPDGPDGTDGTDAPGSTMAPGAAASTSQARQAFLATTPAAEARPSASGDRARRVRADPREAELRRRLEQHALVCGPQRPTDGGPRGRPGGSG